MSIRSYIDRIRHNRGYGVQSPSAFFFVTEVLKEKLPYYAYSTIEEITDKKGVFRNRHARELFRIANHFAPEGCIAVESPEAAAITTLAKPTARKCCITRRADDIKENVRKQLAQHNCRITVGDITEALLKTIAETGSVGLLYIGKCEEQASLLNAALPYTNKKSIIIVEGINRDNECRTWWQEAIKNPRTIVTYDMYSYGILLFDDEKRKQHYTLKR